jgi:hypothetical protein
VILILGCFENIITNFPNWKIKRNRLEFEDIQEVSLALAANLLDVSERKKVQIIRRILRILVISQSVIISSVWLLFFSRFFADLLGSTAVTEKFLS